MKKKKTSWRKAKMIARFWIWSIENGYKSHDGNIWSKNESTYTTKELFDIHHNSRHLERRERIALAIFVLCIILNFFFMVTTPNGCASFLNISAMVFNAYLIDKTLQRRRKRRETMRK